MTNDRVRELVEGFRAELEELIRAEIRRGFEAVLGEGRASVRKASAKPAVKVPAKFASPGRKKGEKRTPEQLAALKEALAAYITKNPGQGIEAIGRGMGVPTSDLSRPVKQLVEAKKVKTTGEKRATKYFPK